MQRSTSATTTTMMMLLLLLLLTVVSIVRTQAMAAARVGGPPVAEWDRYGGGVKRRGFRFGGADRFSHGFGRRRRVENDEMTIPLT